MNKTRVLVVDDEAPLRDLLPRFLLSLGITDTMIAADRNEALHLLVQYQFDLLITDIEMPGATGLQVMIAARNQNLKIKMVAMSGKMKDTQFAETVQAVGPDAMLAKPFNMTVFLSTVRSLLIGT